MAQFFPKKTNFSSFFPRHLFLTRNSSWKNSSFPRFLTRIPKYSACTIASKVVKLKVFHFQHVSLGPH